MGYMYVVGEGFLPWWSRLELWGVFGSYGCIDET